MKVVHSSAHRAHRPAHEVQVGTPAPAFEVPGRAEAIRRALEEDPAFDLVEPTEHGLEPVLAVHHPGLVRYLEGAWSEWVHASGPPELVPDTVLHPAIREGMGPPPEPRGRTGRLGYWCFETHDPDGGRNLPSRQGRRGRGPHRGGRHAVRGPGGLRAVPSPRPPRPRAAFGGYCYFNNAEVAADYLVRATGEPVAVLDVDYYHANGTQQIFYQRPQVLYVSLHADPHRAYPYFAGFPEERGAGPGAGTP